MRRGSIIKRTLAILVILVIFAGTQGFVISSHKCNSCGTHDETISLFASFSSENHDCTSGQEDSCCRTTAPLTDSDNSCCESPSTAYGSHKNCSTGTLAISSSIEEMLAGICCEYNTERVAVETFTPEKSVRTTVHLQPLEAVITYNPAVTPDPVRVRYDRLNKHGGSRDIVLLTCCLLI